jgi:hypothetical protein
MLAELKCEGRVLCKCDILSAKMYLFSYVYYFRLSGGGMLVHVKHTRKMSIKKQTV